VTHRSTHSTRLLLPLTAIAKGGAKVRLGIGTLVRQPFRAAGSTHFLASHDGIQWAAYHTTEDVQTDDGPDPLRRR